MREQQFNELSQDTSIFIKVLKRTLSSFQALSAPQDENVQKAMLIHKVSQQTKYLLQMHRKYKPTNYSANLQIFERMKLKLKELLLQMKVRWNSGSSYKNVRLFLQQVQIVLANFEKCTDFCQFLIKTYSLIKEHLRHFKIKMDLFSNRFDYSKEKEDKKFKRSSSTHFVSQHNVTINDAYYTSFGSLYGLQLDNSYIKILAFTLQKHQTQSLETQLERNKNISKQIQMFSRQFYLKFNRSKRQYRSQLSEKPKFSQNIRIKTTINEKLLHNFSVNRGKKLQTKQNKEHQGSKILFKINNVYVSGNEFDFACQKSKVRVQKINESKKKGSLFLNRAYLNPLTSKFSNSDSKELLNF